MPAARRARQVVILTFPGIQSLDLTGPLEVIAGASQLIHATGRRDRHYEVAILSSDGAPLHTSSGLTITPHGRLRDAPASIDTLIVPGGPGTREALADRALIRWLARASAGARRTASVCTGAFLLAQAGLLDGRRATTHWKFGRELAARYPRVRVEHEPLWVRDGNIYTSAGISAGIDLALAWVEEDCGAALAHEAARELVLFLRRPGGQPQVSVSLASQASEMASLRELQIWIAEHLDARLSVEDLADRMAMSVRNFERVFTREVGTTPSQYVLQMRVEAARRQLERTERGLKQVAAAAGFGSVDAMRRAFVRLLGITPRRYRELSEGSSRRPRSSRRV
jgi:transcriptional regulator GlxA family with amidase domain